MNEESEPRRARIFVGLKVNSDIADQLVALAGELRGTRARLVSASDIHVTLVPRWQETSLDQATGSLRKVAGTFTPFSLKFLRLVIDRNLGDQTCCGSIVRRLMKLRRCATH
jgi:2'-5' RNA ligase